MSTRRAAKPAVRKGRGVPAGATAPGGARADGGVLHDLVDEAVRSDVLLGFLIHDLARTRRRASDGFMKPYGLSRAQWYVLSRLTLNDGMTQTALADVLEIGKANLGMVVETLESAGWVVRQESPSDMRVKRVFLTRQAVVLMRRMFQSEVEFNNQTMGKLSRKERDVLFRLLGKFRVGVDGMQAVFDEGS